MRVLGLLLLLFGVATLVDYFMALNLGAFAWVDDWGDNAAWAIRIGTTVVGVVLLMTGKKKDKKG